MDITDNLQQFLKLKRRHAGAAYALTRIAREAGVFDAVMQTFPQDNRGLKLMSLACFLCFDRSENLLCFSEFAEQNLLPYSRPLEEGQIGEITSRIREEDLQSVFSSLRSDLSASNRFFTVYDLTLFSKASDSRSAAFGYRNVHESGRTVHALYVTTADQGVCVDFSFHDGSVESIKSRLELLKKELPAKSRCDFTVISSRLDTRQLAELARSGLHVCSDVTACSDEFTDSLKAVCESSVTADTFILKRRMQAVSSGVSVDGLDMTLHVYRIPDIELETGRSVRRGASYMHELPKSHELRSDERLFAETFLEGSSPDGDLSEEKLRYEQFRESACVIVSDTEKDRLDAWLRLEERFEIEGILQICDVRCNMGDYSKVMPAGPERCSLTVQILGAQCALLFRRRVHAAEKAKKTIPYLQESRILRHLQRLDAVTVNDVPLFTCPDNETAEILEALGLRVPKVAEPAETFSECREWYHSALIKEKPAEQDPDAEPVLMPLPVPLPLPKKIR